VSGWQGGAYDGPYARSRLDALRRLRDEGYAVVDRGGYERLRKATVDDPTSIYHDHEQMRLKNERLRTALEACIAILARGSTPNIERLRVALSETAPARDPEPPADRRIGAETSIKKGG
jgi:hypothetical protein